MYVCTHGQALAKSLEIKANGKTEDLRAAILAKQGKPSSSSSASSSSSTSNKKTATAGKKKEEVASAAGSQDGVDGMSRAQLQALAKKLGVKANLKTTQLREEIR